ncbi:NAD(P)-binding domain-containing protein [Streptomyces scopuliridis]|uniref:NAD(P)-binding domain-containing protein n=1 Tax=Streptomyces scopuliridis TaxID=452529 RepID=UPI003679885B
MNIAVLGTGKVGSTLGARLTSRGHRVLYGSRTPTGPDRLDHRSAVTSSDLVVTALPGNDVLGVLNEIGDEATRSCSTPRRRSPRRPPQSTPATGWPSESRHGSRGHAW